MAHVSSRAERMAAVLLEGLLHPLALADAWAALDGKPAVLRIFQRRHPRRPRRIAPDRLDGARRVADRGGGDGVDAADILGRLWPHRSVGQPESTRRRRCRSAFTDGHLSKAAAGGRRQRREDRPFRKQTPNASVRPYVASN